MRRLLVVVPISFLLLSAMSAAPVPRDRVKEVPLYHPTTVGTKRVYTLAQDELVAVVTAVQEKEGAKVVTVDWLWRDEKASCEKLLVSAKGVLRLEVNEVAIEPPCYVLEVGRKPGDRCEVNHTDTIFRSRARFTACDPEAIRVPAGVFRCVTVESEHRDRNGTRTSLAWYAPGVGLVKEVVKTDSREWVVSKELKSITQGKE